MAYSNKALPPGTVLREWRLEQVLGVGGFGIVYKGRGIYFDELVAIKEYFPSAISERAEGDTVVPTDSGAEEVHALGLKKFVEEAKLLWNLSKPTRHPNIVSVRSLFEIHGTAYMVMDFEDGVSLSDILKSGKKFTEASLMALIRPISEGLERAHRVGVLHRDIKPPNILVSEDGRPVLIDFGSARFDAGKATNTKVTFHTPPYAAIEQYVKTYEQGPWTDVYALGVVLYECVTGEKPPEVLERLHGGAGSPLAGQQIEGFSPAFLRGVDAAMTIRPSDRPQTIPQWLAMFDPDYEPAPTSVLAGGDEAATRFAAFQDLPEEIVPVAPPPEAAEEIEARPVVAPLAEEPAKAEQAAAPMREVFGGAEKGAESARSKLRPVPLAVGAVVLVGLAGGGYYLAGRHGAEDGSGSAASWIPALSSAAASGQAAAAPAAPMPESVPAGLRVLADEAHQAGAPGASAIAAAAEAVAKLDPATQADQIASQARATTASFAATLARDSGERTVRLARSAAWADSRQAGGTATPQQRATAATLHQANAGVATAAARVREATDPAQAIAAARTAIAAYSHFGEVYARTYTLARASRSAPDGATASAAATTQAAPSETAQASAGGLDAKIDDFNEVHSSAKAIAGRVIAMGKQNKSRSSDSAEAQRAYSVRQANAVRAKQYADHLNLLARSIRGAKTEAAAQAMVNQAQTVRGYLNTLQADSTASLNVGR